MSLAPNVQPISDPHPHPVRRIVKWAAVLLFGVLLLMVASGVYQRVKSGSHDAEPFDLDAFKAVKVDDAKNADKVYRTAAPFFVSESSLLKGPEPLDAFEQSREQAVKDWNQANADVRNWLTLNRKAMEIWKDGSRLDDCLDLSPGVAAVSTPPSPALGSGREFARLALLEASRRSAEGHAGEAWDWYRAVLRSSRHVGLHAGMVWRMVGSAMQATATEPIIAWSARPELSAAQLRLALKDTLAAEALTPPTSDCLKAEYMLALNSFDEFETDFGGPAVVFKVLGVREHTHRSLRLCFANWLGPADRPRFRRPVVVTGPPDLYEREAAAPAGSPSPEEIQEQCGLSGRMPSAMFLSAILPTGMLLIDAVDREEVRRSAVILALALELFVREHGELPADLGELVKGGYLKTIPADPFGKGEPFHYRRGKSGADGGLLWSVWVDQVDDDGKVCVDLQRNDTKGDLCFPIRLPTAGKPSPASPAKPPVKH
jgi:hypothetical protein